jgi:hypothetical protein
MKKTPSQKPGPSTSAGKAISSKNSTKHGLCGNPSKLFPGETHEQYNMVRDRWFAEYDSDSPGTAMLLEQLINCDRQIRFSSSAVMDAEIALHNAENASQRDESRIESLQNRIARPRELSGNKQFFRFPAAILSRRNRDPLLEGALWLPNVECDAKTRLIPDIDIAVLDNRIR